MARLPQPGSDSGTWGNILNDYLSQALKPDGTIKDGAVTSNTIAPNAVNATSIADGSITNNLIADGTIQEAKLAATLQTKIDTAAGLATNGTLTNPTLVSPKIDTIYDTNNNPMLGLSTFFTNGITDGNVNYLSLLNSVPGSAAPTLSAIGPDTDIGITVTPKGTGSLFIWSPSDVPTIAAGGPGPSQNLNFVANGKVLLNNVEAATISTVQTLTNKTLTAPQIGGAAAYATGGTLSLYNTSDQTTNYERARHYWNGNVYNITTENGGTGTNRNLQIGTANRTFLISQTPVTAGIYQFSVATATSSVAGVGINGSLTQSSGGFSALAVQPTITQTSTAGYTALLINPTESTVGTGTKLLADFQVGGASFASISNIGVMTARNFASTTVTRTTTTSLGSASASFNPCNATTAAFTITLPNANIGAGYIYEIIKVDSTANAVTVASAGGTINGAATVSLATQYKFTRVRSDGTNWLVLGSN